MGPEVPADCVRSKADESRVWDPGENSIIEFDEVTKSAMRQSVLASA